MSVVAPKNTLAYQRRGRPLAMSRALASAPVNVVSQRMRQFGSSVDTEACPQQEAIWFYLTNHAMQQLDFRFDPEEPLPEWAMRICEKYHERASRSALRAFYYLLLICAREARHTKNKLMIRTQLEATFGKEAVEALQHYPDHNSLSDVADVFENYAKDTALSNVTGSVLRSFEIGSFAGAYGGPKWAKVTEVLHSYVMGETTAEMLLDTVWTLAHNTGPIFNKGMLYECQDNGALQMVLDIQRGGQIPRLVLTPYGGNQVMAEKYVTKEMVEFAQAVSAELPDGDFRQGVAVDFAELMKLGAVGNYQYLIGKLTQPVHVAPAKAVSEKTHFIIAKKPGLMFAKKTRAQLKAA